MYALYVYVWLGKRSLPEGCSSQRILVGVNNEGIKVESITTEIGNTADEQIETPSSKDPVKNKKYINRKKIVHRIFWITFEECEKINRKKKKRHGDLFEFIN